MNWLCKLTSGSGFLANYSLTPLCLYICVSVCDVQFVIVIKYDFLSLTGKEEKERGTRKKGEKKPHSWAKILDR